MDDKERLKRRKKALQNAGYRNKVASNAPASAKDLFCFRVYVTVIIVGLTIALSFMPSASTKVLTGNLKQAIAHKVSMENMQEAWQKTTAMLKGLETKTKEKIEKTEGGDENIGQKVEKENTGAESTVPTSNEFIPDLPDDP